MAQKSTNRATNPKELPKVVKTDLAAFALELQHQVSRPLASIIMGADIS